MAKPGRINWSNLRKAISLKDKLCSVNLRDECALAWRAAPANQCTKALIYITSSWAVSIDFACLSRLLKQQIFMPSFKVDNSIFVA